MQGARNSHWVLDLQSDLDSFQKEREVKVWRERLIQTFQMIEPLGNNVESVTKLHRVISIGSGEYDSHKGWEKFGVLNQCKCNLYQRIRVFVHWSCFKFVEDRSYNHFISRNVLPKEVIYLDSLLNKVSPSFNNLEICKRSLFDSILPFDIHFNLFLYFHYFNTLIVLGNVVVKLDLPVKKL